MHLFAAFELGHYDVLMGVQPGSTLTIDTTAGRFIPPNRCALTLTGNPATSGQPGGLFKYFSSPQATFSVGGRFWTFYNSDGCYSFLSIFAATGRELLRLTTNGGAAADVFQFGKVNPANQNLTVLGNCLTCPNLSPSQPDKIDFQVLNFGTQGTINVFLNSALIGTYTGDLTFADNPPLPGGAMAGCLGFRNQQTISWSSFFGSTETTVDREAYFRPPAAAGDTDQWTGGVANVGNESTSELVFDTATAAGQVQLYTTGGVLIPRNPIVRVVDILQATAGVQPPFANLQTLRKLNGTIYNSPTTPLPATTGTMSVPWDVNPATGQPWTIADVNSGGYQIGYESVT